MPSLLDVFEEDPILAATLLQKVSILHQKSPQRITENQDYQNMVQGLPKLSALQNPPPRSLITHEECASITTANFCRVVRNEMDILPVPTAAELRSYLLRFLEWRAFEPIAIREKSCSYKFYRALEVCVGPHQTDQTAGLSTP